MFNDVSLAKMCFERANLILQPNCDWKVMYILNIWNSEIYMKILISDTSPDLDSFTCEVPGLVKIMSRWHSIIYKRYYLVKTVLV